MPRWVQDRHGEWVRQEPPPEWANTLGWLVVIGLPIVVTIIVLVVLHGH